MAAGVCSAQASLSVRPSCETFLPSTVYVVFSLSFLVAKGGAKQTLRLERLLLFLLSIIFIGADVRAIGSAFRSSHRQDRYLKRADATIPASPETIRVLNSYTITLLLPDVQQVSL